MTRLHRLIAVVVFAVVLLVLVRATGLQENFSLDYLHRRFVEHAATGVFVFIALFALGNLMQVPGWIFLASAELALGPIWGGLLTYVAAVLSCIVTFLLIRQVGGDALRGIGGKRTAWLFNQLETRPVRSVAWLRVLMQTLPALNYALALSGVKFRHYLIGTLLGLPLPIALYMTLFDSIAALLHLTRY